MSLTMLDEAIDFHVPLEYLKREFLEPATNRHSSCLIGVGTKEIDDIIKYTHMEKRFNRLKKFAPRYP
ncbi:MAG: hypothetical protein Q7S34_03975 [bacterium]|nr:hypothetical protein [bacterium]